MARSVTRQQLEDRVYQRANLENHAQFAPNTEVQDCINEALSESWDLLVAAAPPDYIVTTNTFTTTANTIAYNLPADFLKPRAVFVDEGNGRYRPIDQISDAERERFMSPTGNVAMVVRYIYACPLLTNANSSFDGVDGWEEHAVLGAAIRLLTKEAANMPLVGMLQGERERQAARIQSNAPRNPSEGQRVTRRANRWRDPYYYATGSVIAYQIVGSTIELYRRGDWWP